MALRSPPTPHLANSRILLSQSHDDDAVGLADAALRPRGQRVVCLVEDDPVDVLLLAQPAGQAVLVDAEEDSQFTTRRRTSETSRPSLNAPVERRSPESLFDDVTGQQEGGTCGSRHTLKGLSFGAAVKVLSGLLSPMARSACCSSRVKVVRGTSSDTGRTATVDRLDAWFPASH